MERCNIILRTLGATMLALGLVLIPLSQAEAEPCPNEWSYTYCDWDSECDSFDIYPFTMKKYEKVIETLSGCEINRECSSSCMKRFYNP